MIKAEAIRLGFSACGIAQADRIDARNAAAFCQWIQEGHHATMDYMANNMEKRLDPRLLHPECKSVISMALNYYPKQRLAPDQLQFAYYAYGKDYHDIMKQMMRQLSEYILSMLPDASLKLCCDTVPILDRYWAWKAGLGWIGKNTSLIIPHAGSFFFLCEILIDKTLDYDSPMPSHCGNCTRCLQSCPTKALAMPYSIDTRKCLSFLTIENRSYERLPALEGGNCIYGCDRCQQACPHNKFAQPTADMRLQPSEEFLNMRPSDWRSLTIEQYRRLFKGSAVKRAKYEGLMRNIRSIDRNMEE
ncbi:MAG: tRNA epoxyqueuosine(34) reductase QueG [Roseburia sp.]|nr:tRNA epoxyqueuosine(34) reductase QueG [Roseburia sp.]MCM1422099.1 tRNA epoxyqueuosine(34) reductase QueG [Bacteroides sp.]